MGLFTFIKDAGAKLFGGSSAKAATPDALRRVGIYRDAITAAARLIMAAKL